MTRPFMEQLVVPMTPQADRAVEAFGKAFDATDKLSLDERLLVLISMQTVLAYELVDAGIAGGAQGMVAEDLLGDAS